MWLPEASLTLKKSIMFLGTTNLSPPLYETCPLPSMGSLKGPRDQVQRVIQAQTPERQPIRDRALPTFAYFSCINTSWLSLPKDCKENMALFYFVSLRSSLA